MKKISSGISGVLSCTALFIGTALVTTPTTCHAFAAHHFPRRPFEAPVAAARQRPGLHGSHGSRGLHFRDRGGAPVMAISQAAVEEIENADEVPTLKDPVAISDFEALDVRVGCIVVAELIPDPEHDNKPSRKYLSLVVDLGNEKRRVVSAVRAIVDVEDAIGKSVLIALNVEEETILGRPSRGRLLSASNFSKKPMPRTLRTVLLGGGGVPPGSVISGL
ncbi:unnamed protein product [Ascophyllum nodosum]